MDEVDEVRMRVYGVYRTVDDDACEDGLPGGVVRVHVEVEGIGTVYVDVDGVGLVDVAGVGVDVDGRVDVAVTVDVSVDVKGKV